MSTKDCLRERRSFYYGAFAICTTSLAGFGSVVSASAGFRSAAQVWLVFGLGALQAALGIVSGSYGPFRPRNRLVYYVAQCSLLTAILALAPAGGLLGIIVLPVVSQGIFHLSRGGASLVGAYLFLLDVGVWSHRAGWRGAAEAAMSYSTAFAFTIAFTVITRQALNAREREATLRAKVEDANRRLREYAMQAEGLATTRERNRVAREIHDGLGHYLTVVKTQLDAAMALMPSDPARAGDAVLKASKLAAEALDDVRRSVGALRSDVPRSPLPDALRALSAELGLPVTLRIDGTPRELAPAYEHALFRSVQEALTNVRKHAAASAAEVTLDFTDVDRVTLAVVDDGRGVQRTRGDGFGLRGIRERIELLGGRVESGNRDSGGFALRVDLPVREPSRPTAQSPAPSLGAS